MSAAFQTRQKTPFLLAFLALLSTFAMGCQELKARRAIQAGSEAYAERKFLKAAKSFEEALAMGVDGDVKEYATNNAGMAYSKLYEPGKQSSIKEELAENDEYAAKAAKYLRDYLRMQPKDTDIQKYLSQLWIDSGQIKEAENFWKEALTKNPKDVAVIKELARINVQSERPKEAVKWYIKVTEVETDKAAKIAAYLDLARFEKARMASRDLVDGDRLEAADIALASLAKAAELAPNNMEIVNLQGQVYSRRAWGQGSPWSELVEQAAARHYQVRAVAMRKAADKEAEAEIKAGDKGKKDKKDKKGK